MTNQPISGFTDGSVPNAGDYVGGYLGATPGVAGANRKWSFTNVSTRIAAVLGLSIASGKTFTASNTLTLTGTDGSSIAFGTGGTAAYTNQAQSYTKSQKGAFSVLTDAATIAVDFSLANYYRVVLGGSRTLGVPTNIIEGQSGAINIRQDSTGSRTLAYSWVYQFPGGSAPVLSTGKYTFDSLGYLVNHYYTGTFTVTLASPGVFTWTAHNLQSGYRVQFTTTGALPTGLSINTTYWVNRIDADTFNVSTSFANLQAGTYVTTSVSQSGVHTAVSCSITIAANFGIA